MKTGPDDIQLKELLTVIRDTYGYDFTKYAEASLKRRVQNFLEKNDIKSVDFLIASILDRETFFNSFVQSLSVTFIELFRDPPFYNSIRTHLVDRLRTYPLIKIWIAGCASGEEAFSMAILLKEEQLLDRTILYATDINDHALELARSGCFAQDRLQQYTQNYLASGGKQHFNDYYHIRGDKVEFDTSLRERIIFTYHNLAVEKPFNEFQFITCRNVLIYFNHQLQNETIRLFSDSLCPFGFLGLAGQESMYAHDVANSFRTIDGKQKIFMRTY
jgi:chemotaxis protein methyltransferase CheR